MLELALAQGRMKQSAELRGVVVCEEEEHAAPTGTVRFHAAEAKGAAAVAAADGGERRARRRCAMTT